MWRRRGNWGGTFSVVVDHFHWRWVDQVRIFHTIQLQILSIAGHRDVGRRWFAPRSRQLRDKIWDHGQAVFDHHAILREGKTQQTIAVSKLVEERAIPPAEICHLEQLAQEQRHTDANNKLSWSSTGKPWMSRMSRHYHPAEQLAQLAFGYIFLPRNFNFILHSCQWIGHVQILCLMEMKEMAWIYYMCWYLIYQPVRHSSCTLSL